MATPTYQESGTGSSTATGTSVTPSYPVTGLSAGDIFIVHLTIRNTTTAPTTWPPTDFISIEQAQTPTDFTIRSWVAYKIATGSESGTLSIDLPSTSVCKMAIIYRFRGTPTTEATPYEGKSNTYGLGTSVTAPTVTSTWPTSLGVCLVWVANDVAVASFTGETDDWTETVAEFTSTSGSDGCLQLQTSALGSNNQVSGGSQTIATSEVWGCTTFALRTKDVYSTNTRSSELKGSINESNTRLSELTGKDTSSNTRLSELIGKDISNNTRVSELTGQLTSNDTRGSELVGKDVSSSTKSTELSGVDTSNSTRISETIGSANSNNTRGAELQGIDTSSNIRSSELIGSDAAFSTRGSELWGLDVSNSTKPVELTGKNNSLDARISEISGKNVSNSTRSSELAGKDSSFGIRISEFFGKDISDSVRISEVSGQAPSNVTRISEIKGQDVSVSTKFVEIKGQNISSSIRNAGMKVFRPKGIIRREVIYY